MAEEHKYREEEVGEIFDLATNRHEVGRPSSSGDGALTLAELQEIGLEVGIEPSRIAEAALAVDKRRGVLPRRTSLGMPISVGRVIELPGAVTDRKWELLIAELRETSGARGEVTAHGGVREWANGDLNAFLEPTETGHRLRLRARKGAAIVLNAMGVVGVSMGLGLLAADAIAEVFGSSVFTGDFLTGPGIVIPLMLAGIGIATLASNLLRLPRWARVREGQMEHLAGRVGALLEEPPQAEESET